jgi:hypothetical protein
VRGGVTHGEKTSGLIAVKEMQLSAIKGCVSSMCLQDKGREHTHKTLNNERNVARKRACESGAWRGEVTRQLSMQEIKHTEQQRNDGVGTRSIAGIVGKRSPYLGKGGTPGQEHTSDMPECRLHSKMCATNGGQEF